MQPSNPSDIPLAVQRAEQAFRDRDEYLQAILNLASDAIITINSLGVIQNMNQATLTLFGYSPDELVGQNVSILMPLPYREEHDRYIARYLATGEAHIIGRGREVLGRRQDGTTFPVSLAVSEIDHHHIFLGIIRDISEQKELQQQILEIAGEEQSRIGRELHDGVQQELTGLSLYARSLLTRLESLTTLSDSEWKRWRHSGGGLDGVREIASKLTQVLQETHRHVQELSRGLMPVHLDATSLRTALAELASSINAMGDLTCHFVDQSAGNVVDDETATQLYRIAQEAVQNSLKHSHATDLEIRLDKLDSQLLLEVSDNGIGLPENPRASLPTGSVGLRTMHYRAGLIGAQLQFENRSDGGVRVRCFVRPRRGDISLGIA